MKNHRGFTLVELLIALSLLGVFALMAFRLLGANFRFTHATMVANDNSARFGNAVEMLRNDVFDSTSLDSPQANVLQVHDRHMQVVEWWSVQNVLWRKQGADLRSWNVGRPVNLKLDGAVALLTADSAQPIAMASIHPIHPG